MAEFTKLKIEGREYALLPMAPIDAMDFGPMVLNAVLAATEGADNLLDMVRTGDQQKIGMQVMGLLGKIDPQKISELARIALSKDVHASGEGHPSGKLGNDVFFNDWFTKFPGDMFPVSVWAIWEKSKGYFIGAVPGFQAVIGGQVFQSQTDAEPTTTSDD